MCEVAKSTLTLRHAAAIDAKNRSPDIGYRQRL
jgi:hypothetical protein